MNTESRSEWAQQVLDNPIYKEAMAGLKSEIYRNFCESTPADAEAREHFWRLHEAAAMFERMLNGYITAGQFEKLK